MDSLTQSPHDPISLEKLQEAPSKVKKKNKKQKKKSYLKNNSELLIRQINKYYIKKNQIKN